MKIILSLLLLISTSSFAGDIYMGLNHSTITTGVANGASASIPINQLTVGYEVSKYLDIEASTMVGNSNAGVAAASLPVNKLGGPFSVLPNSALAQVNFTATVTGNSNVFAKPKFSYGDFTLFGKVGISKMSGSLHGSAVYSGRSVWDETRNYSASGRAYGYGAAMKITEDMEISIDYTKYPKIEGYPVTSTGISAKYIF